MSSDFFLFTATPTSEIYTLSLHDALPILWGSLRPIRGLPRSGAARPTNGPSVDRKSTRLNSSHVAISYAVFCLKKKKHHLVPLADDAGDLIAHLFYRYVQRFQDSFGEPFL